MKTIKLWLTTIATLLCSLTANAHNFEVDGIYYNITSATDLTVSVTCRGSSYDSYSNEYTGEVTIPTKVNYNNNTYRVTSIGYGAFYGCSNLTTITIPEGMKSIEGYAFYNCSSLTSITLPEGVTSIGSDAFYGCRSLTAIAIPSSVKSIGGYAFYKCSSLTSISILKGMTSIGSYAFSGCSSLTTITIPSGVTSIGGNAFSGCSSLTAITIPEKVTSIGSETFSGCSSLSYITLSEGLTTIRESAFSGCRNLSSITIPATVTSIGNNAFDNCSSLRSITFKDGPSLLSIGCKPYTSGGGLFDDCPLESIYLGRDVKFDATYYGSAYAPFYENASLLTLFIGEYVTCIYESFSRCYNLSSITFSENSTLASIGVGTFEYCSSLTSITIPESVTSIGQYAFFGCSALTNLTIGSSVSSIGNYAFANCNDIESIYALNTKAITCDESIFSTDTYNNATLYVPTDRVFAYEKATPWSKFQIKPMKTFIITYMVDGKVYETKEVEYGADITLIEAPVKEGYTFTGWSEAPETMPAEDIVVNGSFIANKYLVTFKIGDEVVTSDSLEYGTTIVLPEVPEKVGYTFSWGEVPETVPAGDVAYEGNYSVNSYKLTFVVDGEIVEQLLVAYGAAVELIGFPTKDGYSFDGWGEAPETMPANDVEICGTFTINKYLVTFKIGDDVIASDSLEFGAKIVSPEAPKREGYTFNGWTDVPETMPAGNVIVSGTFTINSYTITYVVDGEIMRTDTLDYNTAVSIPAEPVKEGYTFSGWGEVPEAMPAQDITIYGTFAINKYMVSFVVDGVVMAANELEYGSAITVPTMPEREGYTFSGWGEVDETVPAHDVIYEACYVANVYRVFYFVGTKLVHTADVAYGEAIPEYVYEPTEEGDVFVGWIGESYDTMPAHDVTYTANITNDVLQWTIDNGQLTIYDLSGRKVTDTENLKGGIYIVNGKKVVINNK